MKYSSVYLIVNTKLSNLVNQIKKNIVNFILFYVKY